MSEVKKNPKQRYARLMGTFWKHPKVRRLSMEARGVLATAWSYCAAEMTNGAVPIDMLEMWAGKRWPAIRTELTARHPERDGSRGEPFIRLPASGDIDAWCHDFTDHNISREEWEQRKRDAADRKAKSRGPKSSGHGEVTADVTRDMKRDSESDGRCDGQRDSLDEGRRTKDEEDPGADAPGGAGEPIGDSGTSDAERIEELSKRYPTALVADARAGCGRKRKRGTIADSLWRGTLERLEAYSVDVAVRAMATFVDKHADGSKGEDYLVGIARGEAQRGAPRQGNLLGSSVAARRLPTAEQYAADATTDEQLEGWGLIGSRTDAEREADQRAMDDYGRGALHG